MMSRLLDADQIRRYHDQGFLVLPGFRSAAACAALRERARAIVADFDPARHRTVFSTQDQARRSTTAAFMASAEGIECFYEEEAFDAGGRLTVPLAQAINKIGHAMHDLDPVFDAFSHGADLAALAADIGLQQPQVWQSMVIFKQPGIGGEVKWHQDASFLHTEPNSVVGFWFALEAGDGDNGCLWVAPGGHRGPMGVLRERLHAAPDGSTRMAVLDTTPWPTLDQALPVEVDEGALVVFDGRLPHYSAPNRSPRSRLAYTLHATDGRCAWSADNWLQRPRLPLRGFDAP